MIALGLGIAAVIAVVGARGGERARAGISVGCGLLAAAIGAFYLLGHDWVRTDREKFAWLYQVGLWLQAHRPAVSAQVSFNSNVGGSILALLLPMILGICVWAWTKHHRKLLVLSILTLLPTLVGLALSQNRGAWLGLSAAGLTSGLLAWEMRLRRLGGLSSTRSLRYNNALIIGGWLLVAGVIWAASTLPTVGRLVGSPLDMGKSAIERIAIWQSMRPLVDDYLFTGSGLGSTTMVYSSYVMMLHVGYLSYAHNLYLQIAIEQGIPGLIAFIWLISSAAHTVMNPQADRVPGQSLRVAALASLTVLVVHGMVDAVPYVSAAVPLMFLPIGFTFAFHVVPNGVSAIAETRRHSAHRTRRIAVVGAIGLVALGALLLPTSGAVLHTNLGAVSQTSAELSHYRWPDWPIQDALRRSPDIDLSEAVAHYETALRWDPHNSSANRRLGQIELSQGEYDAAQHHLTTAYEASPGQRNTRQLLGESYAISGNITEAATLWRTIDLSAGQLDLRQWWYEHIGEDTYARRIAEAGSATQLLPEP